MQPEAKYTLASLVALAITMVIPGGRTLVLPVLFGVLLVLLYWAAKPRPED